MLPIENLSEEKKSRSIFAGRIDDLPLAEKKVLEDISLSINTMVADNPKRLFFSNDLEAKQHNTENDNSLYIVRSRTVSAAQALDSGDVLFNEESRSKQLLKIREFRNDTNVTALGNAVRWCREVLPLRPILHQDGIVSASIVIPMTKSEAAELSKSDPNLMVLKNRALTLINPVSIPAGIPSLPHGACWHLDALGLLDIRARGKAYTGQGVTIAMMDTGVQLDHPEIMGKIIEAWKIRSNPRTLDSGALELDINHFDTDIHGTHVAGLICGNNVGVAPNANLISVMMMPYRRATLADFIRCLDWAAGRTDISLINFSAGLTPFTPDLMTFISDTILTGKLPIMAIGNDGRNNTRSPANYIDGISVGSVDNPGKKVSSFSGSGQLSSNNNVYNVPDVVGPGREVWSCVPGSMFGSMSGTSMAAPLVTGIAALLIEQSNGQMSSLDLADSIIRSCRSLSGEDSLRQGSGLVTAPSRP